MWRTIAGDDFRNLMNLWENAVNNDKKNQIEMMVDGQNFVLFFRFNDNIFGAQEPSRVTFAKLLHPDKDEDPEGWDEDANFMAINLGGAVRGNPTQHMFKKKDVKKITIIDKEEVIKELLELAGEKTSTNIVAAARILSKSSPKTNDPEAPIGGEEK